MAKRTGETKIQPSDLTLLTSAEEMAQYSSGQQFEDLIRKQEEAENRQFDDQRAAARQKMRAQVAGLPTLTSRRASLPGSGPQIFQNPNPNLRRCQEDVAELDTQRTPPPQYRQQAPFTPPGSDGGGSSMDDNIQIRYLLKEVTNMECSIRNLESRLKLERDQKRRLQTERYDAVDAQRRAEDEVHKLKRKVANLDELLRVSTKRERELESELDSARQEITELKRQLHDERCSYESDIMALESRERRTVQQLEDTKWALENQGRRDGRSARDAGSVEESETQCEKSP